ncbi:NAD(P)-binding protein [Hyaloscypha bicolor E]|uniref:NAD(P)-binding protein n=1 Tax=Hyaloscypha bicolor E TaxID=1095630 RepID=A0A2J6SPK2_9HELO|nr:NAD(P)-binding protein [Hyaloscypha bicolor E]PMD52673.1 NAD(P)-binding protein [Hyaloscypha bicolor E]
MSPKKTLVVFGATGSQGGSVIKTILEDRTLSSQFEIRGIARDPSKPSAAALAQKAVTLVKPDLDDKPSLTHALKDAYAVSAVANWQEVMNEERDVQQGENVAGVAKKQNVQHLVWSSLPYVLKSMNPNHPPITEGKTTGVLHFDSKPIVKEYIISLGIPSPPYLLFWLKPVSPSPSPTSKSYKSFLPLTQSLKLPMIPVNCDTGKYVKAILLNREKVPRETDLRS